MSSGGKQQQTSHLIISSEDRVHRILIFTRSEPFHLEASDLTKKSFSLLRLYGWHILMKTRRSSLDASAAAPDKHGGVEV